MVRLLSEFRSRGYIAIFTIWIQRAFTRQKILLKESSSELIPALGEQAGGFL